MPASQASIIAGLPRITATTLSFRLMEIAYHASYPLNSENASPKVIPAVRLEEERPRLRSLKVAPTDLAVRVPIFVGPTAEVMHDLHPYSMPPEAIGIAGTLYLYRDRVRIVAGRFTATHERKFQPGEGSTLPEHRAQHVAAVSGKRAKRYLQREHKLCLRAIRAVPRVA